MNFFTLALSIKIFDAAGDLLTTIFQILLFLHGSLVERIFLVKPSAITVSHQILNFLALLLWKMLSSGIVE